MTEGSDGQPGQIVTFYSFKGGTGRTMALANVAWILAANGKRVLVADWDLESPGLHRFYHPFIREDIRNVRGIIDMIRDFYRGSQRESAAEPVGGDEARRASKDARMREHVRDSARVERYAFSLDWEFPEGGTLDFLSAGLQNNDYVATLGAMDWDTFLARFNGAAFLDELRADMKQRYDYVLIDSRTGLSDIADVCTVHLPDVLVDCFTLSIQGIEGGAQLARRTQDLYRSRNIRVLPVPTRLDTAEKEKLDAGYALAMRRFENLPAGMSDQERREYWAGVRIPLPGVLRVRGDARRLRRSAAHPIFPAGRIRATDWPYHRRRGVDAAADERGDPGQDDAAVHPPPPRGARGSHARLRDGG